MNLFKPKFPEPRPTRVGFVTLVVVSVLVAILLASALNSFTRVSDSALADTAPNGGAFSQTSLQNAPRTTAPKNYLPIIFLNSATAGGAWLLAGNAGTNPATDFLGTLDAQPLVMKTNSTEALRIDASQNVGIGTNAPTSKLSVAGLISTTGGVMFPDGTTQTTAFYRPALPGPGAAATADSADNVGFYSSITIGADGLALISHYLISFGYLKVLHCGNAACNSGNTATIVDNIGDAGQYSSITIGKDGLGLISYYADAPDRDLRVLHCGNVLCNSGNTATIVDLTGDVGKYSSITIGADGLGLISYYADSPNFDLKVFHCGNVLCDIGSATTVNLTGDVGQYSSITIGADGLGLVSYYDNTAHALKVLHCGNLTCNSGSSLITIVDSTNDVGQYSSITIGADGLGLISYWDATFKDLKVLHCGVTDCSSGNTTTAVNVTDDVGQYSSITIGVDGLGLVSYYDATASALKVLHCGNLTCNSVNSIITIVDNAGDVGSYTSVTIGADGLGLISYHDNPNGDLKVFRCSNVTCTPYTRVGR